MNENIKTLMIEVRSLLDKRAKAEGEFNECRRKIEKELKAVVAKVEEELFGFYGIKDMITVGTMGGSALYSWKPSIHISRPSIVKEVVIDNLPHFEVTHYQPTIRDTWIRMNTNTHNYDNIHIGFELKEGPFPIELLRKAGDIIYRGTGIECTFDRVEVAAGTAEMYYNKLIDIDGKVVYDNIKEAEEE